MTGWIVLTVTGGSEFAIVEPGFQAVPTDVLVDSNGEVMRVLVIERVIARVTQRVIEAAHADIRELGGSRRDGVGEGGAKAKGADIEALRTVVGVVREAVEAVADCKNGGGIDSENVVQLGAIDTTEQTPAGFGGGTVEPGVAGFERVVAKVA